MANVEDESQVFLSLGGVSIFAKLRKRAANISEARERGKKRPREPNAIVDVYTPSNKLRGCNYKATPSPKDHGTRIDVPLF